MTESSQKNPAASTDRTPDLPTATLDPAGRPSLLWILPVLALMASAWLAHRAWSQRGATLSVRFEQGHGLREGAEVRHLGIAVGEVRRVALAADADGVDVLVRLDADAADFAREGARFWVVRPEIGLGGVRGMETLFGPRYIAALPGDGAVQRSFVGMEQPVWVGNRRVGDLEIVLEAPEMGELASGTVVSYRGVPIGTVLSAGLSSDARSVEASVHIRAEYAGLIRARTRFFQRGGLQADWGSKLLWLEFGGNLLRTLAGGSILVATPDDPGPAVTTGHRFRLDANPEAEWLSWQPSIAIGGYGLPPGVAPPTPLRARLQWQEGSWLKTRKQRAAWVLACAEGLLGPADSLRCPDDANPGSGRLEVEGQVFPVLRAAGTARGRGVAVLPLEEFRGALTLPSAPPDAPLDCLAFDDRPDAPLPLPASRLSAEDGRWRVDSAMSIDPRWHGAPVLARDSGQLVGVLCCERDGASVALIKDAP